MTKPKSRSGISRAASLRSGVRGGEGGGEGGGGRGSADPTFRETDGMLMQISRGCNNLGAIFIADFVVAKATWIGIRVAVRDVDISRE